MPCSTSLDDVELPFKLKRKQFPIVSAVALTIKKSQKQTIPDGGGFRSGTHGQLYVALSPGRDGIYTRNIVYKEALLLNELWNGSRDL
ncbi:hypothetical protein PsorP6_009156 [Peronosclerospora sorghi]|uniref:Uncharacterized protein n=1 Tax=Peronosclerospora sorghi TaxID=230839 RepID=A0ACC0VYV3_9STRA|nr:hypothetical protein PsorP6_009156 [Peronosclerospora sorghi]